MMLLFAGAFCLTLVGCSPQQPTYAPNSSSTNQSNSTAEAVFGASDTNSVAPSDVINEVSYFYGGGPGGSLYCDTPHSRPTLVAALTNGELMQSEAVEICGLTEDQTLTVVTIYPNGISDTRKVQAILDQNVLGLYQYTLVFKLNLNDLPGTYVYMIQGNNFTLKTQAYFSLPKGPHIYAIDENHLLLYGFAPAESVRLVQFTDSNGATPSEGNLKPAGWQMYETNTEGQLNIRVPHVDLDYPVQADYVAVGGTSGEAYIYRLWGGDFASLYQYQVSPICSKVIQESQKIQFTMPQWVVENDGERWESLLGDQVTVQVQIAEGLRLYSKTKKYGALQGVIPDGEWVRVMAGPYCEDDGIWWYIISGEGKGYAIGEDSKGNYLSSSCGISEPGLYVGESVRVQANITEDDLNIRTNPGFSQDVVTSVPKGAQLTVSGGFICVDNSSWWRVRTGGGEEGWAPEYTANGYYLDPIQSTSPTAEAPISKSSSPLVCGELSSRLTLGKLARVAYTDGNDMRIRSHPGLSQSVVNEVPEGTQFTVLDGPRCADNITWWKVQTNGGSDGWMAEYSNGVYLLEPYP